MDKGHETKMRNVTVILNNLAADFQREQYDDRTKHSRHHSEENSFSYLVDDLAAD
jgi:hypothetical protein